MIQNKQKFYFATMPVESIFPYCYVARRQDDPIEGFQRNLSEERARDIAKYLDDSRGSIPTNIVLSAQPSAEFEYDSKNKSVRYKKVEKGFLVLDGQHRLWGYSFTKKKHRVPVAIYVGLSRQEEASLFIDINTNQRGVPAALLLDIKQVAQQETEDESTLRKFFDDFNADARSPFVGYLSPFTSARGRISRVTFNRAFKALLGNEVVIQLGKQKQFVLFLNYFRSVEETLRNPLLLRKQAYFEAFCEFLPEVLRASREKHKNYKESSLKDVLAPISNIDLESVPTGGKTSVSKGPILKVLHGALAGQLEVSEDMI
ncbi:MAG: DGQHR domain-containing protein [Bacteroidetes bacterium]|nr:DGQHR domain-containing protein [Bacteroidota bacterium]